MRKTIERFSYVQSLAEPPLLKFSPTLQPAPKGKERYEPQSFKVGSGTNIFTKYEFKLTLKLFRVVCGLNCIFRSCLIGFLFLIFSCSAYPKIPKDLRLTLNGRDVERFFDVRIHSINDLSNRHDRQTFTTFIGACHAIQVKIFGLNHVQVEKWPKDLRKKRSLVGKINWNVAVSMFKLYKQLENQYPEERSFWKWYKFGSDKMRLRSSEEGLNELLARHVYLSRFKKHCQAQLMPSVVEVLKKLNSTNNGIKDET